jgi:hypothetical protein
MMYFFAALIGGLLSYFSFKLFDYTRKRSHLFLLLSFLFITLGFVVLAVSNAFTLMHFEQCNPDCVITREQIFRWIVRGNYIYYATSIIGYSLFFLSYSMTEKRNINKKFLALMPALLLPIAIFQPLPQLVPQFDVNIRFPFPPPPVFVLYPFESSFFQPFHIISSILLLLIVYRTYLSYKQTKSKLSMLIPAGFAAILLYHVLMFSLPFSPLFFAFAHLSLLVGFGLLLSMLVKVRRK